MRFQTRTGVRVSQRSAGWFADGLGRDALFRMQHRWLLQRVVRAVFEWRWHDGGTVSWSLFQHALRDLGKCQAHARRTNAVHVRLRGAAKASTRVCFLRDSTMVRGPPDHGSSMRWLSLRPAGTPAVGRVPIIRGCLWRGVTTFPLLSCERVSRAFPEWPERAYASCGVGAYPQHDWLLDSQGDGFERCQRMGIP